MSTTSFVGRRVSEGIVPVRRKPLRLPLPLLVVVWLVRLGVRVLLVVARSPELLLLLALFTLGLAVAPAGVGVVIALYVWLAAVVLGVALACSQLRTLARSRWRQLTVYRYKWPATMDFAGLNRRRHDGTQYEPVLLTSKSSADVDVVRARMLAGQTVDDWAKAGERLCQTFGAQDVRVRSVPGRPHEVECWFLVLDPLVEVIAPREHQVPVDLSGLPVGLREDGEVYRLPLLGNHILLAGRTGSGKSSAEWAIVDALAPAIADGSVEVWGVDPKNMEFGFGEQLFARLSYATAEDHAAILEEAVTVMRDRQRRLRGVTRLHQPSQAEPLIVVMIDELAALSYVNERDVRRRIENALGLLLSQGRAVGVTVVGAIQDPRKETLPARGLYTVRVLLAVNEADEVGLVFSPGARDRGARADKISDSLQGVAFVEVDGVAEPVRVRFAYVDDYHIGKLSAGWRPQLSAVPTVVEDDAA